MKTLIKILSLSSGRDKFCKLIQHCARYRRTAVPLDRALKWKRLEKDMSEGRKIFRLFKFLNEIEKIRKVTDPSSFMCAVQRIEHSCSFGYYLFDHLLWMRKVGIVTPRSHAQARAWKRWKTFLSFLRLLFALVVASVRLVRLRRFLSAEEAPALARRRRQRSLRVDTGVCTAAEQNHSVRSLANSDGSLRGGRRFSLEREDPGSPPSQTRIDAARSASHAPTTSTSAAAAAAAAAAATSDSGAPPQAHQPPPPPTTASSPSTTAANGAPPPPPAAAAAAAPPPPPPPPPPDALAEEGEGKEHADVHDARVLLVRVGVEMVEILANVSVAGAGLGLWRLSTRRVAVSGIVASVVALALRSLPAPTRRNHLYYASYYS